MYEISLVTSRGGEELFREHLATATNKWVAESIARCIFDKLQGWDRVEVYRDDECVFSTNIHGSYE